MATHEDREPKLREPSAQRKQKEVEGAERREPREEPREADAWIRPVPPAARGRKPLFRV